MVTDWFMVQTTVASPGQDNADKTVIVRLRGELDVTVRTTLEELLGPLPGSRPDRLVIDLAEVDFMDCGTTALLLRAAQQTLPPGEKPVIRAPRPVIRRLLRITGWDRQCVMDICPAAPTCSLPE